jgi:hypothetical protein
MTIDELAAKTGSKVSGVFPVVYRAKYDGKEQFFVGNFYAKRGSQDHEILAQAGADIAAFFAKHFPDGVPLPKVIGFERGALRLYLDDDK